MTRKQLALLSGVLMGMAACAGPAANEGRPSNGAVVAVEGGRVSGAADGDVRIYRAIPFAAPPVGQLRWRPPGQPRMEGGGRDALAACLGHAAARLLYGRVAR